MQSAISQSETPFLKICISPFENQSVACRSKSRAISTFAYASAVPRGLYISSHMRIDANGKPSEARKQEARSRLIHPSVVVEIFC
jgi:hypothetical protein